MTVESLYDSLVAVVSCGIASAVVFCLSQVTWRSFAHTCARRGLVSATGAALLAFAIGMTSAIAKRTGTTGVSPVAWTAAGTVAPHMESRHLGGDVRSSASDFWLSRIDPSSNSVELGVAWLPGAFAAPPFIEFFVNTNLEVGAWTLLGWAEAEAGETNLCVDVEVARLPGGTMPPAAFFRATAYDGLGADYEDEDGDGIPNGWENSHGTNPLRADTDGDGIPDGEEAAWASIGEPFPDLDLSSLANVLAGTQTYATFPPSVSVSLPFAVEMAGHVSTGAVVHVNGIVAFPEAGGPASLPAFSQYVQPSNLYATTQGAVAAYGFSFLSMGYTGSQLRAGVVQGTQGRWFVAEWSGMQDPMGFANLTFGSATFRLAVSEADPGTFRVQYVDVESMDTTQALFGAHGFGGDPNFSLSGSIPDGTTVAYRFGSGTSPTNPDSDGDGLPDGWEAAHGMDPQASNTDDPRTDASADPDLDGLTNAEEAALGTDPFQPDSDGDGMDDGWESRHGFDPTTHNSQTERDDDDADADPDLDGLTNAEECAWGTNPRGNDENGDGIPDGRDTDGDGVADGAEVAQGSDPADATDEGKPNSRTPVSFYFGDHSSSCSEKYRLTVSPVPVAGEANPPRTFSWVNARYDQCETRTAMLMPGYSYEVRLTHASTKRPQGPDYDYTLNIVDVPQSVIVSDPDSLLGVHSSSDTFTGAGLVATIHALAPPKIIAPKVIGVNNDDDNGNGTPDRQDNGVVNGDDDIVGITISARCPTGMTGTLTVRPLVDLSAVSVWRDRARTELEASVLTFPVSGSEGTNLTFYIEGDDYSASYMYERIQASLACGNATSTNEHRFTVVERIAEPITTEREGGQIVNPCCAVIGASTPMKVQVFPTSFPDSEIKWKVVSGSGTFANGGTGRSATFTATGPEDSETKLQVDVGDCPGRAPQFTLRGTTMHEVKIYPCVIHPEGESSPITSEVLNSMLEEVNVIFRQIGICFYIGAEIRDVADSSLTMNGLTDTSSETQILNIMSGTDGIEIYFIRGSEQQGEPLGRWTIYGIILKDSTNAKTLAHEIGHVCGWCDIFYGPQNGGVYPDLDVLTRRTWLPNDWNNGTGVRFYAPRQIHGELIKRLLMSGYGSEAKSDIPYGDVHGRPKQGESTLLAIGRNNLLSFDLRSM